MNILFKTIRLLIFYLLISFTLKAQEPGKKDFRLSFFVSSGINYTYESNITVAGTYKKNSIPVLGGFELLYKDKIGVEITSGYFPVMFYSNIRPYHGTEISVDASLIAYPLTFAVKYFIGKLSLSAGGSICLVKSEINISSSDNEAKHNSFGFTGAAGYSFNLSESFLLSPGISYYRIPEVGSSTLSFQVRIYYRLFGF